MSLHRHQGRCDALCSSLYPEHPAQPGTRRELSAHLLSGPGNSSVLLRGRLAVQIFDGHLRLFDGHLRLSLPCASGELSLSVCVGWDSVTFSSQQGAEAYKQGSTGSKTKYFGETK